MENPDVGLPQDPDCDQNSDKVVVVVTPTLARRTGLVLGLVLSLIFATRSGALQTAWARITGDKISISGSPVTATNGKLSKREIDAILHEPAQRQAEDLLQAAINHYEGASEVIEARVDSFHGQIRATPRLAHLDEAALYSNDLRVRAAANELMLAAYNYEKSPTTVDTLIARAETNPENRPHVAFALGMLASRGVETPRVLSTLKQYAYDQNAQTGFWAVEGIAIAGTKDAIPMLLDIFHNAPNNELRERAGCGLSKSGSFTQEERMLAVPILIEYVEKNDVDQQTEAWFYQALREITNVNIPNQPAAWRDWLNKGGGAKTYGSGRPYSVNGNS